MPNEKMKTPSRDICQDTDGNWTVSLPKSLYEKPTVFAAAYKFNSRCTVNIEPDGEKRVQVTFRTTKTETDGEALANEFCMQVIDQQCRQDLQSQFGYLRDLIVEQAFKPVADLKDKLK